ncbi:MAG: hypothetical protein LQ338_006295 [Usnochroma carphineum]|nr:MAG: hypothetical protein LQ338_006295 [Usnochroma carphineum]
MFRCAPRLPRTFGHLHCPALSLRRCFAANPRSSAKEINPAAEEPLKEPVKRRWIWLGGLGVLLGAGSLGATFWFAGSEGSQRLQPDDFQDYELLKNKRISNTSNLLTIQPSTFGPRAYKSSLDGTKVAEVSKKGIWSVQIKHPLLTIARLYTPLPPFLSDPVEPTPNEKFAYVSSNPEENQLRFLIRNYPDGELSKYLSRMQAGGRLELRGPYQEYELPNELKEVVFLAGGTGISPAIQVAHNLLENESDGPKPRISILWANRRTADCSGGAIEPPPPSDNLFLQAWEAMFGSDTPQPASGATSSQLESPIVQELSTIKTRYTGDLEVAYFADDQNRFITKQDIHRQLRNSTRSTGNSSSNPLGIRLMLISGPDGFVEHFAGPKVWKEGKELQGTLGGVLQKMDLQGWSVWKL